MLTRLVSYGIFRHCILNPLMVNWPPLISTKREEFIIPYERVWYTMGRGVDMPWVGAVDQNTMGRGVNIPWIGGQNTMGRGVKIPWYFDPPTHGILTPLPMVFWPPYPWYFDPHTHGILTPPAYLLIWNEGDQNTMWVQFTIQGGGVSFQ